MDAIRILSKKVDHFALVIPDWAIGAKAAIFDYMAIFKPDLIISQVEKKPKEIWIHFSSPVAESFGIKNFICQDY